MNTPPTNGKSVISIIAVVIGSVLVFSITTSTKQIGTNTDRSIRNEERVIGAEKANMETVRLVEAMDLKLDEVLKYIYSRP